jgi:hypothetical protein
MNFEEFVIRATTTKTMSNFHTTTRNDVIETCNLCYAGAYVTMNQVSNFYPWPKSAIQVAKSVCIGRGGKSPCLPAPKHIAFAAFAALAVPAEHELQLPDDDVADTVIPIPYRL